MTITILKSALELSAIILLLYGFVHEKDLIEIEELLFKIIKVKYKIYKRDKQRHKNMG